MLKNVKKRTGTVNNLANSEIKVHFFNSSMEPRLEIVQRIIKERQTECNNTRLEKADKNAVVATSVNEN